MDSDWRYSLFRYLCLFNFLGDIDDEEAQLEGIQEQLNNLREGMTDLSKDVVRNFGFMKKVMKEIYSKMLNSNHTLKRMSILRKESK